MTTKPTVTIFHTRIDGNKFRAFVKDIVDGKRVTIFTTEKMDDPEEALEVAYEWAKERNLKIR